MTPPSRLSRRDSLSNNRFPRQLPRLPELHTPFPPTFRPLRRSSSKSQVGAPHLRPEFPARIDGSIAQSSAPMLPYPLPDGGLRYLLLLRGIANNPPSAGAFPPATTAPPSPPSSLLQNLYLDQRPFFLGLWDTIFAHLREIPFDLNGPGWTLLVIKQLGDAIREFPGVFSISKTGFCSCTLPPFNQVNARQRVGYPRALAH